MSFLNSIKNNSKKYETPFDHWEYSDALNPKEQLKRLLKQISQI